MNKEKYIVISGSYSKICLADDIKEAVEIAECFISLEKYYFEKKEENKPRIFKVIEEIELGKQKENKTTLNLENLENSVSMYDCFD